MKWEDDVEAVEEDDQDDGEEWPVVGVAMPMGTPESDDVFAALQDECEKEELLAARVDHVSGSAPITEKFRALVDMADAMILDLSGPRGNVIRELGIVEASHDMDRTILIAKEGTPLPSDVLVRPILFFRTTEHLRQIIRLQLGAIAKAIEDEDDEDDER